MDVFLRMENVNAGYDDLQILKDVSLELQKGTITVLMGPNGAGKSTLLESIFNLVDISSGHIYFKGAEIIRLPAHQLLAKGIAFVSQGKINFDTMSVEDNLRIGATHIDNKEEIKKRRDEVYDIFPVLKAKKSLHAFALSGGEQQMLALGRALMSRPELLLLDEPSLGLAPKLVKEVFEKILEIQANFNTTVLVVEHNLKSIMSMADYGYVLVHGEVVAQGSCAYLRNSAIMESVFVGGFE